MSHPIQHELSHHEYLYEKLKTDFPNADEETLADTLEGLTNLPEMLAEVVRSQRDDLAFAAALRARMADMQVRLSRFDHRAEKKRDLVISVMERAGLKKLTEPDLTVSLRPSQPPLVVIDEEAIPQNFWKPQAPKLDRKGLIGALHSGRDIPGAVLGNGAMTISVRTK